MDCKTELIDYADTGYFSSLMLDYLHEDPKLKPFYLYSPTHPDFEKIIAERKAFSTDRKLLVAEIQKTYLGLETEETVKQNIQQLSNKDTFTICTAHQPNLFTGYLYFVYKILHAIKLASFLKTKYPEYHFVPVYYMGSEDNDLNELGTIHLKEKTLRWDTKQSGAVGRMTTTGIKPLIDEVADTLGQNEYAREVIELLKKAYLEHDDIQEATLYLVNALFGSMGLVVINADTPGFKKAIQPILEKELFQQESFPIVNKTIERLSEHYHAQATPREINLFYLDKQLRERIVREDEDWHVLNTDIRFNEAELRAELKSHPEKFSPNVILRGLLQETILPNVAFIGGGGELAYWMELKDLFLHYKVPYPLLKLRNSVLWVDEKSVKRLKKIDLQPKDLFTDAETLINDFVSKNTRQELVLNEEYDEIEKMFASLTKKAENIDVTLKASVGAQKQKVLASIGKIEHKFLRAEKKKFTWQSELIRKMKSHLFPRNALQERVENILPFYAVYGSDFIDTVYAVLDPQNPAFTLILYPDDGCKTD